MYRGIQEELDRQGSGAPVTDYLNFFCLGNRHSGPRELQNVDPEQQNTDLDKPGIPSALNRRFMIYVHAKFMVVDDEVAIIGARLPMPECVCSKTGFQQVVACVYRAHGQQLCRKVRTKIVRELLQREACACWRWLVSTGAVRTNTRYACAHSCGGAACCCSHGPH